MVFGSNASLEGKKKLALHSLGTLYFYVSVGTRLPSVMGDGWRGSGLPTGGKGRGGQEEFIPEGGW